MGGALARIWAGAGRLVIASAVLFMAGTFGAQAQAPFQSLPGNWSGGGQIKLDNGKSEALTCRAYYTQKEANTLGIAIRCASPGNKIELRANLNQNGNQVSGTWEERTYNASGNVTGKISGGRISLAIAGGSFAGSMNVSLAGEKHSVSIETDGIGLKAVNISLARGS